MKLLSKAFFSSSIVYVLLGGFLFRLLIARWLLLGYDEGYYYLYTKYLDWSYFDHPVMVALTTGLGIWLTGIISPLTLRLGTLILYTGSLFLLYLTSRHLFNQSIARLTLIIASLVPIFQLGFGIITLPDSPLVFFWTATLYLSVQEFFPISRQPYFPSYRLSFLGIFIGLACLSKYHGFVLALALIGFCLSHKSHRCALFSRWLILGIILFIVTLFPLLYWNFNHDWISFKFQLFRRFIPFGEETIPETPYNFGNVLGVLLVSIGLLFPPLGFPYIWVIGKTGLNLLTKTKMLPEQFGLSPQLYFREKLSFLLWISLPLILGFTLLGGKQQILVTWPMPGYWGATLLLGLYTAKWQKSFDLVVKRWLKLNAIAILTLLLILLFHIQTGLFLQGNNIGLNRGFIPPRQDVSSELIDIEQLRLGFSQSPTLLEALKNSAFVFTNAYYLGGLIELAIYPLYPLPVTCFSSDRRGFFFWPDTEQWLGQNALYVTLERFHDMPSLTQEFASYFQQFEEIGTIPLKRGGVITEVFHIYQGKTLLRPYPFRIP